MVESDHHVDALPRAGFVGLRQHVRVPGAELVLRAAEHDLRLVWAGSTCTAGEAVRGQRAVQRRADHRDEPVGVVHCGTQSPTRG